jgi:hypothetical protein
VAEQVSTSLYRPPKFIAGLDVGQVQDPSALTVLERQMRLLYGALEPYFFCRHLERIPLRTPYPKMVHGVRERLDCLGQHCLLVIDATGVGRAVVDLFREGWTDYDPVLHERVMAPGKPAIMGLTLTVGAEARMESWDEQYVPKRDVVMAFMLALQQRRFQAASSLAEVPTLLKEAQNFQWKVSKGGDDLYGAWREGQHDDLLLAACIAVWVGEQYAPVSVLPPGRNGVQYARGAGNPVLRHTQHRGRQEQDRTAPGEGRWRHG